VSHSPLQFLSPAMLTVRVVTLRTLCALVAVGSMEHLGTPLLALVADDACSVARDGNDATCALNALQIHGRRLQAPAPAPVGALGLRKLRRREQRLETRGPDGSGKLEGAAFADYAVNVGIGSQTFQIIVDTGSSTFAVAARAGEGCEKYYTGPCTDEPVGAKYGSGSWQGVVCGGPEVTMAGLSAGSPVFAGIEQQDHFLTDCTRDDEGIVSQGIVGMAYPSLIQGFDGVPLFDSIVQTTGVPNIFSMQCCGWKGGQAATGQLVLGGVDSSLYTGDFQYTPITRELYFCVDLLDISVAGAPAPSPRPPPPTPLPSPPTPLPSPPTQSPPSCDSETGGTCFFFPCDSFRGEGVECIDGLCVCPPGTCSDAWGRCVPTWDDGMVLASAANATAGTHSAEKAPTGAAGETRLLQLGALGEGRSRRRLDGGDAQQGCSAIVDSGTSEIVLSPRLYKRLLRPIQAAAKDLPADLPCVTDAELQYFPDVVVKLGGGVTLTVPPTTYFQPKLGSECLVLFFGRGQRTGPNILGQPLMEAYYTVFDKQNSRVGFAPIAGCQ